MAQYKLYTGGPYTQNDGSEITNSSTDINLGAAKGVKDSVLLNRTENSSQVPSTPDLAKGVDGAMSADSENGVEIDSFTTSSEGLIQAVYASAHGLSIGDMVIISDNSFARHVYRVVRVIDGDNLVLNDVPTSTILLSGSVGTKVIKGTYGVQGSENFIMKKNDATVHGQAETKLSSGAADNGRRRKVAKSSDTVRTVKVGTAIRNGKYDAVNGEFDNSFPESSNDSMNSDDETIDSRTELGLKGELTYRDGGRTPTSKDYEAKTA